MYRIYADYLRPERYEHVIKLVLYALHAGDWFIYNSRFDNTTYVIIRRVIF